MLDGGFVTAYEKETKRTIILSNILADEFNKGYEDFRGIEVKEVNNFSINSMDDLRQALEKPIIKKKYTTINFKTHDGELILDNEKIDKANKRISQNYGLK